MAVLQLEFRARNLQRREQGEHFRQARPRLPEHLLAPSAAVPTAMHEARAAGSVIDFRHCQVLAIGRSS